MHWLLSSALILTTCFPALALQNSSEVRAEAIYGDDNRIEICDEADHKVRDLARGVLAQIPGKKLKYIGNNLYRLDPESMGERYNLCKSELFYHQPTASDCTAFLIGNNLLATAGHCVPKGKCNGFYWVANYQLETANGVSPSLIPSRDVYACKKVLLRKETSSLEDYAVIELNRPVIGGKVLSLRQGTEPTAGDWIFVIGHPMGLPMKIAGGATIRKWGFQRKYFVTNLDTYGGNSGSPVFNSRNLKVEGILVRGDDDFVDRGNCKASKRCGENGCRGEDATNISFITDYLNSL